MAERKRLPWYQSATPDQRRGINALAFRRDAEAAIFRTNVDTRTSPSYGENVANAEKQGRRNPLEPRGPKASDDVSRETSDALERFREVDRASTDTTWMQARERRNRAAAEEQRVSDASPFLSGLTRAAGGLRGVVEAGLDVGGAALGVLSGDTAVADLQGGEDFQSTVESAQGRAGRATGQTVRGAVEAAVGVPLEVDRVAGAPIRGALLNPSNPVRGALTGYADPAAQQLRNMGGIRSLPDEDIIGPLSLRDIVGGAADALADVGTVGAVAKGGKAAAAGIRAIDDDIVQAAIRQAEGPVERSFPQSAVSAVPTDSGIRRVRTVGGGAADDTDEAVDALRNVLKQEKEITESGTRSAELNLGRRQQLGQRQADFETARQAGLTGEDVAQNVRLRTGAIKKTTAQPVELTSMQRHGLFERLNRAHEAGQVQGYEWDNATRALGRALDGIRVDLQPKERQLLERVFGDDVVEGLVQRNARGPSNRAALNIPGKGPVKPPVGVRGAKAPPGAASVPGRSPAARQGARVGAQRDRDLAQRAAEELREEVRLQREADRLLAQQRKNIPRPPPRGPRGTGGTYQPSSTPPSIRRIANEARDRARKRMGVPPPKEPSTFWQQVMDVLNIPRSIKSAFDISAPFRQGGVLSARNPREFWGAWEPMVRSMGREATAEAIDAEIRRGPAAVVRQRAKLYLAPLSDDAALSTREEAIMSRMAARIPGIDRSQRGYVTFLNKLRADFFDKNYERLLESGLTGKKLDDAAAELAKFTNYATGRGELRAGDLTSALTNLFFSPRLLKSRFDTIRATLPKNLGGNIEDDLVRQIARENVGAWMGQNIAVLSLLAATGVASVELDPRSSDWGKIRIGPTRIDPWAGFQQIGRGLAQLITGERKTSSGDIQEQNRAEGVLDFARSKANPTFGVAIDQAQGKTMLGDPVRTEGERLKNILGLAYPLSPQDIYEGWQEDGLEGAALGATGIIGFGVTAYSTVTDAREEVAQDIYGRPYDELNKADRDRVDADERVKSEIEDIRPRTGDIDQRTADAFERLREVNSGFEQDLALAIASGAEGKALRDAISDFKEKRYDASQVLISDDIAQNIERSGQPPEDVFSERYWSVTRPADPVTGRVDWDGIESERAQILADAEAAGIDTEYILGNGEGTYRGTRFDDEDVRAAVESYEDTTRALGESGLWDADNRAWSGLLDVMSGDMQREASQFDSFEEYRDTLIDQLSQRIATSMDLPSSVARVRAEQTVSSNPAVQAYTKLLQRERSVWAQANADLAEQALASGYLSPSELNLRSTYGIPASPSRRSSGSAGGLFSGSRGSGGLFD